MARPKPHHLPWGAEPGSLVTGRRTRPFLLILLSLTAWLLATGCGDAFGRGEPGPEPVIDPQIDYSSVDGSVRIDGSSTVFPISEAVAEEFSKLSGVRVNVGFSGTGGGIEKFCRGDIDISDASRPIKPAELERCAANGITGVLELRVAIDALTVVIHPENTWATCMTPDELHQIFRQGGARTWRDIRPEWPDDHITIYYPGADSGTFDYFNEAIIHGIDKQAEHRSDGTASEDDNILARGVSADQNAIGYFGIAYFTEAGANLQPVSIDDGEGCVEPTFENAYSGRYTPLSRPLFIYTTERIITEKPEVLAFIKFYLDNLGVLPADVGYVTMPEADIEEQQRLLEPYLGPIMGGGDGSYHPQRWWGEESLWLRR